MVAKRYLGTLAVLSVIFPSLSGCYYRYEYRIEGKVISLRDNEPVEDFEVSLKTFRQMRTTKTTSDGEFSFMVDFSGQEFDSREADCTLLFSTDDSSTSSIDVSLDERPTNQKVKCVVFIGIP